MKRMTKGVVFSLIFFIFIISIFLFSPLSIIDIEGNLVLEQSDCDSYDSERDLCSISGTINSDGRDIISNFDNLELNGILDATGNDGWNHQSPSGYRDFAGRGETGGKITINGNLLGSGSLKVIGGRGGYGYYNQRTYQPHASLGGQGGDGGNILIRGFAREFTGDFFLEGGKGGKGYAGFDCGKSGATDYTWCGRDEADGQDGKLTIYNIDYGTSQTEEIVEEVTQTAEVSIWQRFINWVRGIFS